MKKTLVAIAALAVVGAASAQSSVTLYGRIDVTVQNATQKTGGVKTAGGNVGLQVNSAGLSGSRWGMKGSEDLGGGLNAIFQLESGFSVDDAKVAQGGAGTVNNATGAVTSPSGILFGRQAYVGLSGGFGQLTLGRQYTPIDNAWSNFDTQGQTTASALTYAWNKGIHADVARVDNTIYYKTPSMGGFWADAMYAPGENKQPVIGRSAGRYFGGSVGYNNGPLGVVLAYENNKVTTGTTTFTGAITTAVSGASVVATPAAVASVAGSASTRDTMLGAQYDLGVVKLFGAYERASNSASQDDKGWSLGVGVPIGAASLNVGFARETTDANTAVDGKSSAFAGQLVYPLSKRTNVYADFVNGKTRAAGAVVLATTKNTVYGVGMRHDF